MTETEQTKILLVEDDNMIGSIFLSHLQKAGFGVELAKDADEASQKIEKEIPTIIVLDIILPGMSGFEFLEKLKSDDKTKQIPVVVASNLGSNEEIQKGKDLGAVDYFVKTNILPEELTEKIKGIVESI